MGDAMIEVPKPRPLVLVEPTPPNVPIQDYPQGQQSRPAPNVPIQDYPQGQQSRPVACMVSGTATEGLEAPPRSNVRDLQSQKHVPTKEIGSTAPTTTATTPAVASLSLLERTAGHLEDNSTRSTGAAPTGAQQSEGSGCGGVSSRRVSTSSEESLPDTPTDTFPLTAHSTTQLGTHGTARPPAQAHVSTDVRDRVEYNNSTPASGPVDRLSRSGQPNFESGSDGHPAETALPTGSRKRKLYRSPLYGIAAKDASRNDDGPVYESAHPDHPTSVRARCSVEPRPKHTHRHRRPVSTTSTATMHSAMSDDHDSMAMGTAIPTHMHAEYNVGTVAYDNACAGKLSTGETVDFVLVAEMPAPIRQPSDLINLSRGLLPNGSKVDDSGDRPGHVVQAQWRMHFEGRLRSKHKLRLERCVSANGLFVYTLVHIPLSALRHSAHHAKWPMRLSKSRTMRVLETDFPHQHLVAHAHRKRTWGTMSSILVTAKTSSVWSVEHNTVPEMWNTKMDIGPLELNDSTLHETIGLGERVQRAVMAKILHWFPLAKETHFGPYVPTAKQQPHPWTDCTESSEERCYWPYDIRYQNTFELTNTPEDSNHFSSSTRSMFLHDILSRTNFRQKSRHTGRYHEHDIGIEWLIHHGAFTAAFPLHDGPMYTLANDADVEPTALRSCWKWLYGWLRCSCDKGTKVSSDRKAGARTSLGKTWAQFRHMTRPQPLDAINEYFGSRVAMYFVFLSNYTTALMWPSLFGFIAFVYGLAFFQYSPLDPGARRPIVEQVCNSSLSICGPCASCSTYELGTMCTAYEATYVIDNAVTPVFAFLMALWSSAFLDFWGRTRSMYLSYWNLNDATFRRTEHRRRPEFKGSAIRLNLITGKIEEFMPDRLRRTRSLLSAITMAASFCLVYGTILVYIVVKRAVAAEIIARVASSESYAIPIAITVGAAANLLVVIALNFVFVRVAAWLTFYENHETKYSHAWHLSAKKHIFSLISTNALCLYIVFVKTFVHATPHDTTSVNESCSPYGCQLELALQLMINVVCKAVVQDRVEQYFSKIRRWYCYRQSHRRVLQKLDRERVTQLPSQHQSQTAVADAISSPPCRLPWEEDFEDESSEDSCRLFNDFNKLAIQFSFCTFFVTALPLAPLIAFFNNVLMLRIDARKYTNTYRRVIPHYDTGISIWFRIFEILSFCGVLSTGFVMAFSSQVIPRYVHDMHRHGDFSTYVDEHFALYKAGDCSFPSTLNDDGSSTRLSLTILCVRLIFLICFENAVYIAKIALNAAIPSVPHNIRLREELARHVSEAVIAEVTGVASDPSSSEGDSDDGEKHHADTRQLNTALDSTTGTPRTRVSEMDRAMVHRHNTPRAPSVFSEEGTSMSPTNLCRVSRQLREPDRRVVSSGTASGGHSLLHVGSKGELRPQPSTHRIFSNTTTSQTGVRESRV